MRQGTAHKQCAEFLIIIYIAWPPVLENGFVKAMSYHGMNRSGFAGGSEP